MTCGCRAHNGFLTKRGLQEAALRRSRAGVDTGEKSVTLDKVGSVSGLGRGRDILVQGELFQEVIKIPHGS